MAEYTITPEQRRKLSLLRMKQGIVLPSITQIAPQNEALNYIILPSGDKICEKCQRYIRGKECEICCRG